MNMKVVVVILILGVAICGVTSYFMYTVFQPMGIGWVGISLSVIFFLFVMGGVLRAMMTRRG